MPEKMISGRKSIHDKRDSKTPQPGEDYREEIDQTLNDTHDQITTESDSESKPYKDDADSSFTPETCKSRDYFNVSRSVPRTPPRPKQKPLNASPKPNATIYTKSQSTPSTKNVGKSSFIIYSSIAIVLVLVIAIWLQIGDTVDTKEKDCSFEKLQKHYPQQKSKLWKTLEVGIESILNKRTESPAVYLFAHEGGENVLKIIKDVAVHSSTCFGKKMQPIVMESDDFNLVNNDYGNVIEKYKAKIKQGNVILIANLNKIPAEAARAFHTICDTYSPIAKDVVIFLTITKPPNKTAEDTLYDLWASKLKDNELDALITRVTDQVIVLQS